MVGGSIENYLSSQLDKGSPVETRPQVGARLGRVCDRMREYQLASHIYAFASFLEPMLSENFDKSYLARIAEQIQQHAISYRELYSEAYDVIERGARGAVDATVLGGVSRLTKGLGKAIAATPIGDHTPIDEALTAAGKGVGQFNDDRTVTLMAQLHDAKDPGMLPFKESVESVSRVYNQPMRLAADSESVYLVPEAAAE